MLFVQDIGLYCNPRSWYASEKVAGWYEMLGVVWRDSITGCHYHLHFIRRTDYLWSYSGISSQVQHWENSSSKRVSYRGEHSTLLTAVETFSV